MQSGPVYARELPLKRSGDLAVFGVGIQRFGDGENPFADIGVPPVLSRYHEEHLAFLEIRVDVCGGVDDVVECGSLSPTKGRRILDV